MDTPPAGYRMTAAKVLRIAAADPRVKAELKRHPKAIPYEYTKGAPTWQVSWFSDTKPERELLQVYVDDNTGAVTQAWTGFQVAWTMARGYPGAFGRRVNAWYLWVPLCILFVAPFIRRRPALLHLDLLVLLGFSISLAFFNHGMIGLSVPLVYPFLIYLLVRMLLLANGRGRPRRPLAHRRARLLAGDRDGLPDGVPDRAERPQLQCDRRRLRRRDRRRQADPQRRPCTGTGRTTTCTATPTGRSATCSTSRFG